MKDGGIVIVFTLPLFYVSLKEIGVVGLDTNTWGIKDAHKCWSGSLAKRRLCLGPASVINCTPLSALSFWVSLFPGMRGYNTVTILFGFLCFCIFYFLKTFIYFWLRWIFVAVHRFSLVSASRGSSCYGAQAPGRWPSVVAGCGLKSAGSEL